MPCWKAAMRDLPHAEACDPRDPREVHRSLDTRCKPASSNSEVIETGTTESEVRYMKKRSRVIVGIICLTVLVQIFMAGTVLAQQAPPPNKDPKNESRQRQDREATLRSAELGAAVGKVDQKRIDVAVDQVKEDFRRIQIVRNEMVRNLLANKPFNYQLISDEVAEINRRADRLQTSLFKGSPAAAPGEKAKAEKEQVDLTSGELKDALVKLCNLIDHFVESPELKNLGTTDAQQSSKAGADLLKIIELGGVIRKHVLRLNNAPKLPSKVDD